MPFLAGATPITTGRATFSKQLPPPWKTCEAALSEAFHLLGERGSSALAALLRRRAVVPLFRLGEDVEGVLRLMHKYANVPMSFADACFVRMTETAADPVLLTTDSARPAGDSLHFARLSVKQRQFAILTQRVRRLNLP